MTAAEVAARLEPKAAGHGYASLKVVGVAATAFVEPVTRERVAHAAILYRWKKIEVRVFEMRGHKKLRDVPVGAAGAAYVWIEPKAPPERLRLVVQRARLVELRHRKDGVPYGFGWKTSTFDPQGSMRLGAGEIGFTCATIVAAIFEAENVKLVEPDAWPPPDSDDKKARKGFIDSLRPHDGAHARTLEQDISAPRIAPEELVTAAALHPTVGTFANVQDGASVVKARFGQ